MRAEMLKPPLSRGVETWSWAKGKLFWAAMSSARATVLPHSCNTDLGSQKNNA